jgi:hypothetical protein
MNEDHRKRILDFITQKLENEAPAHILQALSSAYMKADSLEGFIKNLLEIIELKRRELDGFELDVRELGE